MRTQLFGRLLPLALLCTAPQTGCSDLFASYLRFGDTSDGGVADAGEPSDLEGFDLANADLTDPPDLTAPPVCTQWSPTAAASANDPWMSETELVTGVTGLNWGRITIGDFDRNGLTDIALATNNGNSSTGNVTIQVLFQSAPCTFDAATQIATKASYGLDPVWVTFARKVATLRFQFPYKLRKEDCAVSLSFQRDATQPAEVVSWRFRIDLKAAYLPAQ